MTILTKPSIIVKKPDVKPLVDENVLDEEKIDIHPSPSGWPRQKRSSGALLCMSITALLVAIIGITSGLMLYRQYLRSTTPHRYQGFCSIPLDTKESEQPLIEPNYRVMPLQWTAAEPDVQVFDLTETGGPEGPEGPGGLGALGGLGGPGGPDDALVDALHEELDIDDSVERISVFDNGRRVSFIHDFDNNITGIVDGERCFTMELDAGAALPPAAFVLQIAHNAHFDVSGVRRALRALLPALPALPPAAARSAALARACRARRLYRLQPAAPAPPAALAALAEPAAPVRKRSVDAPPHDYIQFSGKHVQKIEITNLAELLEYEKNNGA